MTDLVTELLKEVAGIVRGVGMDVSSMNHDMNGLFVLLPNEDDQLKLRTIMADEHSRRLLIRIARHAATAVAFHMLVLLDERRELGSTSAKPKLVIVLNGTAIEPSSDLHERLGEVMGTLGMDTDEWW